MSGGTGIFEDRKTCRISGDVFFESQYKRSYYTYVFVFQISYWWQSGQPSLKRHGQEKRFYEVVGVMSERKFVALKLARRVDECAPSHVCAFFSLRSSKTILPISVATITCSVFMLLQNDVSPEKSEPNPMSIVIATSEYRCGENIAYLCKRYSIAKESLPPDNPTAIRSPSFIIPNTLIVFRNSLSIFCVVISNSLYVFFLSLAWQMKFWQLFAVRRQNQLT